METQSLPIVPFGKYKGEPITSLLNDTKYLDWCKEQEFFKKYSTVYNICVNQTISTNNQSSKTPEHNKLQNMFLNSGNIKIIVKEVNKKLKYCIDYPSKCEFEGQFNWDVIIENISFDKCTCNWEIKLENECCDCETRKKDSEMYSLSDIFIEIKPLIGDDYPCVLRKMKTQMELTKTTLEREKQLYLKKFGYDKGHVGGENWRLIKDILNDTLRWTGIFCLLIKEYVSDNTTKEELIEIFKQSGIRVIFIKELFSDISEPKKLLEPTIVQIQDIAIPQQPDVRLKMIENENKILQEKIKLLEQENANLKYHKQNKTINDFFVKK